VDRYRLVKTVAIHNKFGKASWWLLGLEGRRVWAFGEERSEAAWVGSQVPYSSPPTQGNWLSTSAVTTGTWIRRIHVDNSAGVKRPTDWRPRDRLDNNERSLQAAPPERGQRSLGLYVPGPCAIGITPAGGLGGVRGTRTCAILVPG
jgi:hypothetical protein